MAKTESVQIFWFPFCRKKTFLKKELTYSVVYGGICPHNNIIPYHTSYQCNAYNFFFLFYFFYPVKCFCQSSECINKFQRLWLPHLCVCPHPGPPELSLGAAGPGHSCTWWVPSLPWARPPPVGWLPSWPLCDPNIALRSQCLVGPGLHL